MIRRSFTEIVEIIIKRRRIFVQPPTIAVRPLWDRDRTLLFMRFYGEGPLKDQCPQCLNGGGII